MANNAEEIKKFLRTRRDAVRPSQVGLANYPGRRVPGLRREEVAQLAGVSVDYYTRLEQGRLTSASEGVILSIAEALRLTQAETQYLRDLLRPQPRRSAEAAPTQRVRPELLRMLNGLHDQPAFVLGRRNEVLASNDLLDALFTPFNHRPANERNLLRWMLLDPAARSLYLDWAQVTSEVVGVLRAEAGRNPDDPQIAAFVAELRSVSPEFRTWWAERTVVERTWGSKRFNHPVVGRLDITYEALSLPGDPEQILFVYAAKTDDDLEKLRILASWYAQSTTHPATAGQDTAQPQRGQADQQDSRRA